MLNHIVLHGRLGRDPELVELQGQNGPYKKTNFSVAVDRDLGDGVDWFRCQATGPKAEVIDKWLHKGSEVIVSGRLESYKPKRDPEHTAWILKVDKFDFCGSASNGSTTPTAPAPDPEPGNFEEVEEEIPW